MTTTPTIDLSAYHTRLHAAEPFQVRGRVVQVIGLTIEAEGISPRLGELCWIEGDGDPIAAEVVGFRKDFSLLMPLGEMAGIQPGSPVLAARTLFQVPVGPALLGRVLDGLGNPFGWPRPGGGASNGVVEQCRPPPHATSNDCRTLQHRCARH